MNKICFMFTGQGSQKTGMGKALTSCSTKAKQVFECASDILHYDMLNLCTNEEFSQKLLQTNFAQPAIVAVSLAAFEALIEKGASFNAVVGHSLGSVSALAAAGVVSIQNCFKIVKARAEAMQQCQNKQSGAMCAIIGANLNDIETACKNADGYVVCANFNGTNQVVISGTTSAVEQVACTMKSKARRCIKLNVRAAFHSELMLKATKPFADAIESIEFNKPTVAFFSNVTGKQIKPEENLKKLLIKQIINPVLFTQDLLELEKAGFEIFVELGPNKPLCSMVKSTLKNAQTFNVCDEQTLNETFKNLQILSR